MKAKLLIWDWNGTILNDTDLCCTIANDMLTERGLTPHADTDAYRSLFSFPVIDYYYRSGYTFEKESYKQVSDQYIARYVAEYASCPLREGVRELLARIRACGCSQVLLSATRRDRLVEQAAHYGVDGLFDELLGLTDDLAYSKAELAANFMKRHGVDPKTALFIGDTTHDCEVAQAVGSSCALLVGGHQLPAAIAKSGAPVFQDVQALAAYLEL